MTSQNKITGILAIAALAGFGFFMRSCGINSVLRSAGSDTTVSHDTVIIKYQPIPYMITRDSLVFVNGKPVIITIRDTTTQEIVRIDPVDTAAIVARCNETAYYKDVRDTGRAKITIIDTVTQNRITGREVRVAFTDTTITNTTVLRPPKPIVVSVLLSNTGNVGNVLYAQGIGLSLRLPSDKEFEFQRIFMPGHKPMYQFTYSIPIRLKKKI